MAYSIRQYLLMLIDTQNTSNEYSDPLYRQKQNTFLCPLRNPLAFSKVYIFSLDILYNKIYESIILLEGVDEATFSRYYQFIYTGNYSPEPLSTKTVTSEGIMPLKGTNQRSLAINERNAFYLAPIHRTIDILQKYRNVYFLYSLRPNISPSKDYSETFLYHARIFRFTRRLGWESLYTLSRQQLTVTLANFTLIRQRVEDIVKLLRFIFAERSFDTLHLIIHDYILWKRLILVQDSGFQEQATKIGLTGYSLSLPQLAFLRA